MSATTISREAIRDVLESYNTHLQQSIEGVSKLADSSNELLSVLMACSFPVEALSQMELIALRHDHAKEQLIEAAQLLHGDFQRLCELLELVLE